MRAVASVLMPIPLQDFDPTEVAVSWKILTARGHRVQFATQDGSPGRGDDIMLDGAGLDPWSRVPGLGQLRLIGRMLGANADARRAYGEMIEDAAFRHPLRWDACTAEGIDALLLPGGHRARGMRPYLESGVLQTLIAAAFANAKPVAAICHGVLLVARSKDANGRSVLHGRRTTALTWKLEKAADAIARVCRWWDPNYYRTYVEQPGQPRGEMSVQAEVTRALASPADFLDVPAGCADYRRKTDGLHRDSAGDARPAWIVTDGNYVSARWPGDAHRFAATFADLLDR